MKCFVIMPFGSPDPLRARQLELTYSQWIKPTVEGMQLPGIPGGRIICSRSDKTPFRPEDIITRIVEEVVTSEIVIADLSGRNPNVFYELAVRHAVSNNTILIANDVEAIPFDLRGLRTIIYKYDPEQMLQLRQSLEEAVREVIAEPDRIDNPVRRFLYEKEAMHLRLQQAPPGYDVIKEVLSELDSVKRDFRSQAIEFRRILQDITSADARLNIVGESLQLADLQGVWRASVENGRGYAIYCAKLVNDELIVPYSYVDNSRAVASLYQCRIIGKSFICRFKWFAPASLEGYVALRVESRDRMSGGWWYGRDVPRGLRQDLEKLVGHAEKRNDIIFERSGSQDSFAPWAVEHFDSVKHRRSTQASEGNSL